MLVATEPHDLGKPLDQGQAVILNAVAAFPEHRPRIASEDEVPEGVRN